MAIDPDVQDQLDGVNARLRDLESSVGTGNGSTVDTGIRYVAEPGDDNSDGLSWNTAFATVSKAANLDPYPRHIRIGPGTFVDAEIPWRRGMTIEGSGPGATDSTT